MRSSRYTCITAAAVGLLSFTFGAFAQSSARQNIRLVGQFGGPAFKVQYDGNLAYINEGPNFRIVNASNPASPTPVGGVFLGHQVSDLVVSGNFAYVIAGDLYVIDVSNPASPAIRGRYKPSVSAQGIHFANSTVYLVGSAFEIVDVTDPAAPAFRGLSGDAPGSDVIVVGNLAYIQAFDVLQILNVSNPAMPTSVGSVGLPSTSWGFAVEGGLVYCACDASGLQIVDVADPANPTLSGLFPATDRANDVFVEGNLAYIAEASSGLTIADVSNPSLPTAAGSFPAAGYVTGVWVNVVKQACLTRESDLLFVDVANPALPSPDGRYPTLSLASKVSVVGNHAYVLVPETGLHVFDVRDPSQPLLRGSWWSVGGEDLHVVGSHAYVADGDLRVVDVTDPMAPVLVASAGAPGTITNVHVSGTQAFAGDSLAPEVTIIDVSNPAVPLVGEFFATQVRDLFATGTQGYIAAFDQGLKIIDTVTPGPPALLGTYLAAGDITHAFASNGRAYTTTERFITPSVLEVVDVSDPVQPFSLGEIEIGGFPDAVHVDGALAFTAGGALRVIDVRNPASLQLRGMQPLFGFDVFAANGLVYYISDGLWIYRLEGPRILSATISDVNANGTIEAGDLLALTLDQSAVVATGAVNAGHFFLAVAGDTLGGAGFTVAVNAFNPRQIVLTLGAGASLTAAGEFTTGAVAAGSPSGIDFSIDLPAGSVVGVNGLPARNGGLPGVNDSGVDVELSMVPNQRDIGPAGGTISVVNSPEAAYRRHQLIIPAGALSTTATFRLRPPVENLGVIGAVEIETIPPGVTFNQPVGLRISYREGDVPVDLGFLVSELRICQLSEIAPGQFTYVDVPGPQVVDTVDEQLSVSIGELFTPAPLGGPRKFQTTKPVYAGIPIETVDERTAYIKPSGGGAVVKGQNGFIFKPGGFGAYTEHAIEFVNYEETTASDPARLVVKFRQATIADRFSLAGGQSFPTDSGAIFVVTTEDAAGQPVAFTDPVHITVQFKERDPWYTSDVRRFSGLLGNPSFMGLVFDAQPGADVNFGFLGQKPEIVNTSQGTLHVENVVDLTDATGVGTWGAVAHNYLTRSRNWELYR